MASGGAGPLAANVAIPSIVGGTIALTLLFSYVVLKEPLNWPQLLGTAFVGGGVVMIFFGASSASASA